MQIDYILQGFGSVLNFFKCLLQSNYKIHYSVSNDKHLTILANGPSLKHVLAHEPLFAGEVMVVNAFHKSEYFTKIKPKHYVISAPEFWIPIDSPAYLDLQNGIENILQKIDWDMTYYIPYKSKNYKYKEKIERLNNRIRVQYFNDTAIDSNLWLDKLAMRFNLGMPRPHNVLMPSLMIGIWSNFKTLEVFGADHSWLPLIRVLDDNVAVLSHNHFYDIKKQEPTVMGNRGVGQRKLHEILHKFYLSFKGYHTINDFAKSKNIKIWNATKDSFIDAFDRR